MTEVIAIEAETNRRRLSSHEDLPAIFRPLLQPSRYKGAHGGRGGAKSHVFAELLVGRCNAKHTRAVCVREYQVSLEQSVKRLIEDKIAAFGLGNRFKIFNNYIETPFDGIIIFQGMQSHTADSIKSLEGYDIAWVEEAQSLSQRSLDLLRPTIREEGSELWFSWNPSQPTDPVDRLLRGDKPPNAIIVESSYKDNPYFPDVLKAEMEWDKERDKDKYQHVWLGGYEQHSTCRVFKNWKVEEFDTPADTVFLFGSDWGFSVDPSVLIRCFVDGRKLYIDQEVYMIGCEIDNLPALFDTMQNGMAREWTITADSARPETISYMQRHGYSKMVSAVKGKDSVKEGVIFLQSMDIIVHPRCRHTEDELLNYSYKVDKQTDTVTPILEDRVNHVIDSLRYAVERLRAPVVESWVTW